MFTQEEYMYAWLSYIAGAGLLVACWWYVTAKMRSLEFRFLLRVTIVITLIVPWYTNTKDSYLSPAWIIAAFEGLFEGGSAFWRAGIPLLTALAVGLMISMIYLVWNRKRAS